MTEKILIILHQENSSAGRVGLILRQLGYELDIRKPRFGDKLPKTLNHHKGAVIFGGPMSANDNEDFIKQEIDWCAIPLNEKAPFLGVCLGAQMLVKYMGGFVTPHPDGLSEIGYFPVYDNRTIKSGIMPPVPSMIYQWHSEGFSLPAGAELLVKGDLFQNQAFHINHHAFAVQFHAELTHAMLYRWLVQGHDGLQEAGGQTRKQQLEGRLLYDRATKIWLQTFLKNWLKADIRTS